MLDNHQVRDLITNIAKELAALTFSQTPLIIGIHTGGVWVAEQLHAALNNDEPLGTLDISFYRDDFSQIGLNPLVKSSELPVSIEDRDIILVDDVLHTGRTIRAAMNELFDFGRPKSIVLVALIERDGRQLPIEASTFGMNIKLAPHQQVKLAKQDGELSLSVINT